MGDTYLTDLTLADPHLFAEGQGDAAGDGVGERQPVLGVDEVDEAAAVPHVARVPQDGRDRAGGAHHHACKTTRIEDFFKGHDGGLVVSALAYCSEDHSF